MTMVSNSRKNRSTSSNSTSKSLIIKSRSTKSNGSNSNRSYSSSSSNSSRQQKQKCINNNGISSIAEATNKIGLLVQKKLSIEGSKMFIPLHSPALTD